MDLFLGIMIALMLALIPTMLLLRDQIEKRRQTGKRVKKLLILYRCTYGACWVLFLLTAGREVLGYYDKKEAKAHGQKVEAANTADHDTIKKNTDTIKTDIKIIPLKIDSSTEPKF
jgi:hypothetical protein